MSESDVSHAAGLNPFDTTSSQQRSRGSVRPTHCFQSETFSAPRSLTTVSAHDFPALLGGDGPLICWYPMWRREMFAATIFCLPGEQLKSLHSVALCFFMRKRSREHTRSCWTSTAALIRELEVTHCCMFWFLRTNGQKVESLFLLCLLWIYHDVFLELRPPKVELHTKPWCDLLHHLLTRTDFRWMGSEDSLLIHSRTLSCASLATGSFRFTRCPHEGNTSKHNSWISGTEVETTTGWSDWDCCVHWSQSAAVTGLYSCHLTRWPATGWYWAEWPARHS